MRRTWCDRATDSRLAAADRQRELAVQEVHRRVVEGLGLGGWKDKLAAGFTNSAGMNGAKASTLSVLFTMAQQHGMLWVGTGMMPSNAKNSKRDDINYVASFAGLATTTPADASADEVVRGDLETARLFGQRVSATLARLRVAEEALAD